MSHRRREAPPESPDADVPLFWRTLDHSRGEIRRAGREMRVVKAAAPMPAAAVAPRWLKREYLRRKKRGETVQANRLRQAWLREEGRGRSGA